MGPAGPAFVIRPIEHVVLGGILGTPMRTTALALVVMIMAIASVDPLCCPDGCTRGALALTHHAPTGSDCPICQPGAVAIAQNRLAAGMAVASAPLPPERAVIESFPPTIEHPPRPA
jgi:hypothetical protein